MNDVAGVFEDELDRLLAEGVLGACKREASAFDELAGEGSRQFVLFGAGNLGRRTLSCLRKTGIEPLCFVDNDAGKWGKHLDGVLVLGPSEGADLYRNRATFIVTVWGGEGTDRMPSRETQLRQLGCSSVVPFLPLYWKFPDELLPHYALDLPHRVHLAADRVRNGLRLMADDASRREYLAQLRFRLLGDFACLPDPVTGDIYFLDELLKLRGDETLVDCGAFDGDTICQFLDKTLNQFKAIFGFEPDPANYAKLAESVSSMAHDIGERITLHQAATGEMNKRVKMAIGSGPSSHIGDGDHEVECYALDSILSGLPVSLLKMDIEGSELATLAGAKELIERNTPILAICAYHRQDDLWNIPLFIHGLNPDYSIFLRPHVFEGWDLVCYAIPANRRL